MPEQRQFDWNKVGVQEIHFSQFAEGTRLGLAGTIKRELEGRLKIQTVDVEEWMRVLTLDNALCVMDHAQNRFDIGSGTDYAEQLAAAHALVVPASTTERSCRHCGCTEDDCQVCIDRTGHPCWWVSADECSACVQKGRESG